MVLGAAASPGLSKARRKPARRNSLTGGAAGARQAPRMKRSGGSTGSSLGGARAAGPSGLKRKPRTRTARRPTAKRGRRVR